MASKKKEKKEAADWFDELDEELEKKTEETFRDLGERDSKLADINQQFIKDFWRIWIRFEKINVHFSMKPEYSSFAKIKEFPENWEFKENFDFTGVQTIRLMDKTQDENRVGDTLLIDYYTEEDVFKVGMFFEFCEGETYYKYSGWKRIYARYLLWEAGFPLEDNDMDEFHEILKDVVKVWYESHLKKDRNIMLNHINKEFDKIEEYPE
ncbi:MAG: hypothetical protein R6U17_07475 [Thermoplasmata archaeon]